MRPELKSACLKAAAKLGIGLSLLVALIGIRLVTTTPEGVESGIKKLERLDSQLASEAMAERSNPPDAESTVADPQRGHARSDAEFRFSIWRR